MIKEEKEEKEKQLEFARKLLDTSEGFYVQVGKPTFIMLINIIVEQQKELEDSKFSFKNLEKEYKNTQDMLQSRIENSISKDKIKVKLGYEENEEVTEEQILSIIETMWEEFNRLEDLEDKMVTQYISKDKIREKIKELERLNKEQEIPVLKEYKFIRKEMIDYFKELIGEE
jgi:hypothetical protein